MYLMLQSYQRQTQDHKPCSDFPLSKYLPLKLRIAYKLNYALSPNRVKWQ